MKVYIAFDDCTVVAAYESLLSAKIALTSEALNLIGRHEIDVPIELGPWEHSGTTFDRQVKAGDREWAQWIDEYEVRP